MSSLQKQIPPFLKQLTPLIKGVRFDPDDETSKINWCYKYTLFQSITIRCENKGYYQMSDNHSWFHIYRLSVGKKNNCFKSTLCLECIQELLPNNALKNIFDDLLPSELIEIIHDYYNYH